jgi:PIN domain nuclease of toxin-antitoxin system
VRLLLDTHVLLWAATAPELLRSEAREAIEDGSNEVLVSAVSAWEIAIKQSLGKLELAAPAETWLPRVIAGSGFVAADVSLRAALATRALPWHHRDPFDRLLIAQAIEDGCTLATRDEVFRRYPVPVLAS